MQGDPGRTRGRTRAQEAELYPYNPVAGGLVYTAAGHVYSSAGDYFNGRQVGKGENGFIRPTANDIELSIARLFMSFAKTVVLRTTIIFSSRCPAEHLEQRGVCSRPTTIFYSAFKELFPPGSQDNYGGN